MKRILLFVCCLFAASGIRAQLTLDECRRLARENYPEIRQYDLIRLTTEYTVSNVRRAWLPQLSLTAQATWQTDVTAFPDELKSIYAQMGVEMAGIRKDQYKVALDVSQTLWDGGKSKADRLVAEAEGTERVRSTDVDLYALDGRIDGLYFGILLLEERIRQMRLTQELLCSNLEKVRTYLRNGVATQSDADAVEAELLSVNQQLIQGEASRDSYRRILGIFVGHELGNAMLECPEADEPQVAEPERPELALFDAATEKLAAQELLVRSTTRPRFGVFAQGFYGYPGLNLFEDMMRDRWSWNAVVGVRMQWNFGGYYTKRNSLQQLNVARQTVEVNRDIFLFNNKLQVVEESSEIARLRKVLADDDRIVALRRSVREAAESRLRNGVVDTNDLLDKITQETAAVIVRSSREIELLQAIYKLKHTTNR